MGRLRDETLNRVDSFAHRVVDVAEEVERLGKSRRIVDQMIGSGTSVGANIAEADEAMSRPDFCKTLGIVVKELNESRYWLRFVGTRGWIPKPRLTPLDDEATELKKMFGVMLARTRKSKSN